MGAWALLQGKITEMETGEGKTLMATLAAATAALTGIPVHIITVNDYLAERDADFLQPLYSSLGLSVGFIDHDMDHQARQEIYKKNIVYCTNKEIVFDYLRDRIVLNGMPEKTRLSVENLYKKPSRLDRLLLKGLYFAIIDEADSVLIDEARTPLIISREIDSSDKQEIYHDAINFAASLDATSDYLINNKDKTIQMTEMGQQKIIQFGQHKQGIWSGKRRATELIQKALTAKELYLKDRDYIVKDEKIQIIDEHTGRVMADRSWEHGLHQMLETKEGCEISNQKETLARMSYQRFFRRYLHLSGMTGTASEVAPELKTIYNLDVVKLQTNRPLNREYIPGHVYKTVDEKWNAIINSINDLHKQGRPVLVGTRSVNVSELLSSKLTMLDMEHHVLNAKQDKHEAEIISQAGQTGQITIATSMAGRGTDIKLASNVKTLGGLHVIMTELHDTGRIDRQLFGRCGRQGDHGSYQTFCSLEDELPQTYLTGLNKKLLHYLFNDEIAMLVFKRCQKKVERHHYVIRCRLLKMDDHLDKALAFTGISE